MKNALFFGLMALALVSATNTSRVWATPGIVVNPCPGDGPCIVVNPCPGDGPCIVVNPCPGDGPCHA
jgi:hypothetical protein